MKTTIHPDEIPRIRQWNGERLSPVDEVLMFHEHGEAAGDTFRRLLANLELAEIAYVVVGSLATAVHNHLGVRPDIQVCVRREGLERFRRKFVGSVYQSAEGRSRRFYDPRTQVTFDLLISGTLAGRTRRNNVIRFPDPSEGAEIKGLYTIPLPRLIELKLVTWRFKDWAEVVALIRANKLGEDFVDRIDPLVRMAYLECYEQKIEEDKYEREAGWH